MVAACIKKKNKSKSKKLHLPRDINGGDSTTHCKYLLHGKRKDTRTDNVTGLITRSGLNETLVVVNKSKNGHGN